MPNAFKTSPPGDAGTKTGDPGSVRGALTTSSSVSKLRARVTRREVLMAHFLYLRVSKNSKIDARDAQVARVETGF